MPIPNALFSAINQQEKQLPVGSNEQMKDFRQRESYSQSLTVDLSLILLMEEILQHLGCTNSGTNYSRIIGVRLKVRLDLSSFDDGTLELHFSRNGGLLA